MASLVTSIIGGFQGASASHHAANYLMDASRRARGIVDGAVDSMNPQIRDTANYAADYLRDVASDAAGGAMGTAGWAGDNVRTATARANESLTPYIEGGNESMVSLRSMLAPGGDLNRTFGKEDFEADPGYQFRLQEGEKAIQRSAAARGRVLGGATLKSLTKYNSGMASQEYENAFNRFRTQNNDRFSRLSSVAGMGMTAAGKAGDNTIGAERYAGDMGYRAAEYAGNVRTTAASEGNRYRMSAMDLINRNTMFGAGYGAQSEMDAAQAHAAGDLGAAGQWNNMLTTIGRTGDSMIAGGFSGGGGFNWRNMFNMYRPQTAGSATSHDEWI